MRYLLQLEWLKWRKNRAFLIFTVAYFILLPAVLLVGKKIPPPPPPIGTTEMFFIFPNVWEFLGLAGNWICFFLLGFLSILMVTSEFSSRTLRQNIMTGITRQEYLLSKEYFFIAISLVATAYYVVVALAIGYFHTDVIRFGKVWQHIDYIPRYFLMCFGYMTIGLALGFLIRRTGIALFLYFGYCTIGEMLLRWGVHYYFFKDTSMHYYPVKAISDLTPIPIVQLADEFLQKNNFSLFLQPGIAASIVILFTTLISALVYYRFTRSDL